MWVFSNDSEKTLLNTQQFEEVKMRSSFKATEARYAGNYEDKVRKAKEYDSSFEGKVRKPKKEGYESSKAKKDDYDSTYEAKSKKNSYESKVRKAKKGKEMDDYDSSYEEQMRKPKKDQFYDDGDDGLMLRTVNRKNILQQYNNDSTGPDSESESEITSDDPYDCIVVDDQAQKVRKNGEHFPNVAAIGRKLEKLSKNAKYPPNKAEKSEVMARNERNKLEKDDHEVRDEIMQYREQRHSFKTFGHEVQNDENGEKEDRYYGKKSPAKEKHRYYPEKERKSYDSMDSERETRSTQTQRRMNSDAAEKKEKLKYYRDDDENRQFLPRTKLTKTNSSNSKYDNEGDTTDYGETLQRRHKDKEQQQLNGNMYGPWYDLWGLDASVRK